jgi:ribose transport system ATP-binding protein
MNDATPLLEMSGITKSFTATLALNEVDFDVRPGEIHALLGQNGAGKSTLIKILAGVYPRTAGAIRWRGEEVADGLAALPIAFIHQDLGLVDTMTVAENVALAIGYLRKRRFIDWRSVADAARQALSAMGSSIDPMTSVGSLSAADKSIVAIARALALRCELLVLDEPTAALPSADVDILHAKLRTLRSQGIGLVYVTHRLDEVYQIADRVTVLRDGRCVESRPVSEVSPSELVDWIVGRSLNTGVTSTNRPLGDVVLSLHRVVIPQEEASGHVGPVSLSLRAGEILGLVGLRGAGHHAVGRAIYGSLPKLSGQIIFHAEELETPDPRLAIAKGIGFVSSRRSEEGIAANLTVQENLYINPAARGLSPFLPVGRTVEFEDARRALARFSVRPSDPMRPIATLSGGNQQKVVVARWLEARISLLILEEPTIGVDVGSKAEIYRDLREAQERNCAIILISSDFEEVEKLCDRALVFNRGQLSSQINGQQLTIAGLTALAGGAIGEGAGT